MKAADVGGKRRFAGEPIHERARYFLRRLCANPWWHNVEGPIDHHPEPLKQDRSCVLIRLSTRTMIRNVLQFIPGNFVVGLILAAFLISLRRIIPSFQFDIHISLSAK